MNKPAYDKIIFLDIDGVLNSSRSAKALDGYPFSLKPSCMAKFDMVAVGLIRLLCKETGAKICISSTWRRSNLWSDIGNALDLPVVGATPVMNSARGNEIQKWMRSNFVQTAVIIDDDNDMLAIQKGYFVHVDGREGFSHENFEHAKHILGEKSPS